jgi:hypothetical protein
MGRSFTSVRPGVRDLAGTWEKTARKLDRDDREPGRKLAGFAKTHSSEAFFGCDNPLEAALFSSLLEISKNHTEGDGNVDP